MGVEVVKGKTESAEDDSEHSSDGVHLNYGNDDKHNESDCGDRPTKSRACLVDSTAGGHGSNGGTIVDQDVHGLA